MRLVCLSAASQLPNHYLITKILQKIEDKFLFIFLKNPATAL